MRKIVRLTTAALALSMFAAPAAHATTLAPVAVFSDPLADGFTGEDITPVGAINDLTAGYIGETEDSLQFVFQVADVVDVAPATGVPILAAFNWDFSLQNPDVTGAPTAFELSVAAPIIPGQHVPYMFDNSYLGGNCTTTGTVINCPEIAGTVVTTSWDAAANTVTANVRRADLKDAKGNLLAVDGSVLAQAELWNGISVGPTIGVLEPGNTVDLAVMDEDYVLGTPR
jgi:hypothetical protein